MTPDPDAPPDDEFEKQDPSTGEYDMPSHVGPGGPDFDDSVQPQPGTPVDEEDEALPLDDSV